jgi:superfamily II RNA helicase
MNSVKVFDGSYDPNVHGEFDSEFESTYNSSEYKWDPFQLHSFQAIWRGDDVLVSAPTSSGKSHVGWYAMKKHLFANPRGENSGRKKVIYTAPIKTLSNEKFEEMTDYLANFGIEPGLLTGDHRVNVESDFLIMTAEILANALFRLKDRLKGGAKDGANDGTKDGVESDQNSASNQYELDSDFVNSISCVIMDEIHFISDKSRGRVWEDTIILLDSDVQLIGLSATIDQPESFASWISTTRARPISLIKKYDRPVPLEYRFYDGKDARVIMDSDGNYDADAWQMSVRNIRDLQKQAEVERTDFRLKLLRSYIDHAKENGLFQLCVIVFSKRNCERFAEQIGKSYLSGKEAAHAVKALEIKLGTHLRTQEKMPRYRQIKKLLQKGVSFHHAGMPVLLKEAIEYLYKEGHIKVLFATETVAIGVNMPVRCITFVSLEKASGVSEDGKGSSIRYINAAEFKQICGRAGRRGKDSIGTVVFLPLYSVPDEGVVRRDLLSGSMPKIESRMDLTYHSYLKTEVSSVIDRTEYFNKSLRRVTNDGRASHARSELQSLQTKLSELQAKHDTVVHNLTQADRDAVHKYLQEEAKYSNNFGGLQFKMTSKQRKKMENLKRDAMKHGAYVNTLRIMADLKNEIRDKKYEIESYLSYGENRYDQIREFLVTTEYLTSDNSLTEYAVMVAHINECNPFILAEIFTGNILDDLSEIEVIGLCAILTDPISSRDKIEKSLNYLNVSNLLKDAIYYVQDRISSYEDVESRLGLTNIIEGAGYWNISLDYVELAQTWARLDVESDDHSKILQMLNDLDEYEGSFIKNMLKIDTIVSNLIGLANLTSNLELIPKLEKVSALIVKGMVNTDSLHVQV